jgi:hypothetical protein
MKPFMAIVGTTLLGLLSFTFSSVRNLSHRKGTGWYLDVKERPWSLKHPRRRT